MCVPGTWRSTRTTVTTVTTVTVLVTGTEAVLHTPGADHRPPWTEFKQFANQGGRRWAQKRAQYVWVILRFLSASNPWYWCAPCYRLDFNIAFKISVLNKAPQNLQSRGHKSRCVCGTAKRAFCLDCFGCVPCLVEGSKFSPFLSSFEHLDLLVWDAEHALHPLGPASKTCGRHPNERAELKARPVAIVLWLPCSWYRFYTRWKGLGNISGVMLIHHFEGGQAWDKAQEAGRSHSVFTLKLEASNTTSGGVTSTKVSRCRVVSWNALSFESVVTVVTVVPVVQAVTLVTLVTLGMLWSRYVVAFSLTGWIWST